ncbi:hypothetical protein [Nocardia sp. NPDC058480]|uniref:hypothetical protein n=1 Tax=unclassified Nocardia TaxID=2637762 RepID=UPI0036555D41
MSESLFRAALLDVGALVEELGSLDYSAPLRNSTDPRVLVLDESVAALDVSIQAQIPNLWTDIRDTTGISYLFITHDLAVVRQVTESCLVIQGGRVVESEHTDSPLRDPAHPYTRAAGQRAPPGLDTSAQSRTPR